MEPKVGSGVPLQDIAERVADTPPAPQRSKVTAAAAQSPGRATRRTLAPAPAAAKKGRTLATNAEATAAEDSEGAIAATGKRKRKVRRTSRMSADAANEDIIRGLFSRMAAAAQIDRDLLSQATAKMAADESEGDDDGEGEEGDATDEDED